MTWEADDIKHLRRHIARADELAEKMRAAEAAGDETNAVGAGLALDCEMEWLAPECVNFTEAILDAFDAMERECWALSQPAGDGLWHVLNEGGESIADDESPLVAMLKATATLEGKSDES